MRKIGGKIENSQKELLIAFAIFSSAILTLNLIDAYMKFNAQPLYMILIFEISLIFLRGNIFGSTSMYIFFTFHIRKRYHSLNENFGTVFRIPDIDGSLTRLPTPFFPLR